MDCISPLWKQTWAVSGVFVSMVAQGCVLGFNSCLLSALKAPDSPIKLDLESASWLASAIGLTHVFGHLLACFLIDLCGRRRVFLIGVLPSGLGWLMIFLAENYTMLFIGRACNGIGAGLATAISPIIIGEYTAPKYRGMFLNFKVACINLGATIAHFVGGCVGWRYFAILGLALQIISFIITWTWPESPVWLASKKEFVKSKKAFYWLRGHDEYSQLELDMMINIQEKNVYRENLSIFDRLTALLKKCTKKHFLKPMIITFAAFGVMEASGRHVFPTFAEQIMTEIAGGTAQPHYYMLWTDIVITVSAMFSSVLVRLYKLRTVLFATGISSLSLLFLTCSYLFLVSKEVLSNDYPWIAICSFALYFVLTNLGCVPIPLTLLGEIFPLQDRSFGTALAGIFFSAIFTICLHVTQYLLLYLNVHGMFAVFGSVMALMLAVLYVLVPETKDRTLQEIEDYFYHGRFIERVENDNEHSKMMSKEDEYHL